MHEELLTSTRRLIADCRARTAAPDASVRSETRARWPRRRRCASSTCCSSRVQGGGGGRVTADHRGADRMNLSDRMRAIVKPPTPLPSRSDSAGSTGRRKGPESTGHSNRRSAANGDSQHGRSFVVERRSPGCACTAARAIGPLAARWGAPRRRRHFWRRSPLARRSCSSIFESTGLSGGAGTHVFMVGCGWFGRWRVRDRQFLLAVTRRADAAPHVGGVGACGRAGQFQRQVVRRAGSRDPLRV